MLEAVSALPSSDISEPIVLSADPEGCDEWVWLRGGAGWGLGARVRGDLDVSVSRSRQKTLRRYVGRSQPLEFSSEWVDHTMKLSGALQGLSLNDEAAWLIVSELYAPVCYRDMFGRRMFVSVDGVDLGQQVHLYQDLAVTMTQIDSQTAEGIPSEIGIPGNMAAMWRENYAYALSMDDSALAAELTTYAGWLNWYDTTGGFGG